VLVDLTHGKSTIGVKWIYKLKFNMDGSISKHKEHLVAQGYVKQEGVDYDDTFSPVARMETVRIFLSIASQLKLIVYQMDKVYRLKKELYDLKQAPRSWYSRIDDYLPYHVLLNVVLRVLSTKGLLG